MITPTPTFGLLSVIQTQLMKFILIAILWAMGEVRFALVSVTDIFLVKNSATPAQRRRACAFRFPHRLTNKKAPMLRIVA